MIRPGKMRIFLETTRIFPDRLDDLVGAGYADGVFLILDVFLTAPHRRSLALAMDENYIFTVRFVLDTEGLTM